jgi:peptide/nickel transport system ATP-binding protein
MSVPLLRVDALSLEFRTRRGIVHALENVSLDIGKGEIVGVVGESGSGKSVLAYAIMSLLDATAGITSGNINFGGLDLMADPVGARELRGREISMIFQSPRTALNPIRKVGQQIEDVLLRHGPATREQARSRALEALARVRIPDPERRYHAYPFELSGGMCQRVMIAMALACKSFLLVADEPTTGLDVTTQAVIMDLVRDLVRDTGMSVMLITHDLGLAAEYCDRMAVMHAGHLVEAARTAVLLHRPRHPYTRGLLAATPLGQARIEDFAAIPGALPDLRAALPPCRFRDRCERREPDCDIGPLTAHLVEPDHLVSCRHPL